MVFCSAVISKNFHFIETRLLAVILVRLPSELAPLHCIWRKNNHSWRQTMKPIYVSFLVEFVTWNLSSVILLLYSLMRLLQTELFPFLWTSTEGREVSWVEINCLMGRFNREEKPATFAEAKEILSFSLFKRASSRGLTERVWRRN